MRETLATLCVLWGLCIMMYIVEEALLPTPRTALEQTQEASKGLPPGDPLRVALEIQADLLREHPHHH